MKRELVVKYANVSKDLVTSYHYRLNAVLTKHGNRCIYRS